MSKRKIVLEASLISFHVSCRVGECQKLAQVASFHERPRLLEAAEDPEAMSTVFRA